MLSQDVVTGASGVGHVQTEEIRTLLLDDSPFDRARIKRVCRKADLALMIEEVQDLPGLEHALHTRKFDLVLIDYHLPGGTGLDALKEVLDSPFNETAAKIMISGSDDAELARMAFEVGCHEFLNKDWLQADDLKRSVERSLIHARRQRQMDAAGGADVMQLKSVLETTLTSAVSDVLRSELTQCQQMRSPEEERALVESMGGFHEEYIVQERLNAFLRHHSAGSDIDGL